LEIRGYISHGDLADNKERHVTGNPPGRSLRPGDHLAG
jgi:hypothetical protein